MHRGNQAAGAGGAPATIIASHGFEDGTDGVFHDPWGGNQFIDDPTPRATGKVARLTYAPTPGYSDERAIGYFYSLAHDTEYWAGGKFYIPDQGGNQKLTHNRKLFDFTSDGVGQSRITLHRVGAGDFRYSIYGEDGVEQYGSTGLTLNADTWYKAEVRIVTNSPGSANATVQVYLNDANQPSWTYSSALQLIQLPGDNITFFSFGRQLTIDSGDPAYSEYRYWDDVYIARDGRP